MSGLRLLDDRGLEAVLTRPRGDCPGVRDSGPDLVVSSSDYNEVSDALNGNCCVFKLLGKACPALAVKVHKRWGSWVGFQSSIKGT
jgi:hypothetical protein